MQRMKKDIYAAMRCNDLKKCGITVEVNERCMTKCQATITGPVSTVYEGGSFDISVQFPVNYPFTPPEVKFRTHIWHPNISSVTGLVCIDVLKSKWCGGMTLSAVLLSVQNLLNNPEPWDPQDEVVGLMMQQDKTTFYRTALHWTYVFAIGPYCDPEYENAVARLQAMGCSVIRAVKTLSNNQWSLEEAVSEIFGD